jgi:hypothetical protein
MNKKTMFLALAFLGALQGPAVLRADEKSLVKQGVLALGIGTACFAWKRIFNNIEARIHFDQWTQRLQDQQAQDQRTRQEEWAQLDPQAREQRIRQAQRAHAWGRLTEDQRIRQVQRLKQYVYRGIADTPLSELLLPWEKIVIRDHPDGGTKYFSEKDGRFLNLDNDDDRYQLGHYLERVKTRRTAYFFRLGKELGIPEQRIQSKVLLPVAMAQGSWYTKQFSLTPPSDSDNK